MINYKHQNAFEKSTEDYVVFVNRMLDEFFYVGEHPYMMIDFLGRF